jgi:phosphopantetheine adenylyltransferase
MMDIFLLILLNGDVLNVLGLKKNTYIKMKQTEIQIIEERIKALEKIINELKIEMNNKLNAMNSYYAKAMSNKVVLDDIIITHPEIKKIKKKNEKNKK